MQYINDPRYSGIPMDFYNGQNSIAPNQPMPMQYQNQQRMRQIPQIDPRQFETPEITLGDSKTKKSLFTIEDSSTTINVDPDIVSESKNKRGRKKSSDSEIADKLNEDAKYVPVIFRDKETPSTQTTGTIVEDAPTSYSYYETTGLLRETLGQIDAINGELVKEFTAVKNNRTMKNKYNVLVGLSENIGDLISNRIAVIREINSSISKSNDLDYKKLKDNRAAQAGIDDDKYIADLYKSFISNPQTQMPTPQIPQIDPSILGSGIVRADVHSGDITGNGIVDMGYLNYQANLTPEQNMMRYENDPNVKQVVVYDAQTGNKFFQVMNVSTGQVINNVPTYDQMFMEDTTIDLNNRIAKNINLNETFPLIVINDNITSQY